jgi:hypothetical protein
LVLGLVLVEEMVVVVVMMVMMAQSRILLEISSACVHSGDQPTELGCQKGCSYPELLEGSCSYPQLLCVCVFVCLMSQDVMLSISAV